MGLYDRDYARDNRAEWSLGAETMVVRLIVITCAIYLVQVFFDGPTEAVTNLLMLKPLDLHKPWLWWRVLTYGFTHDVGVIGHVFMNMFVLWMFGRDVEGIYGKREFAAFYLVAIVLGGLTWATRHNLQGIPDSALLGASGAVTAVFILFVLHFPFRNIYFFLVFPVPAWILGLLYVVGDLAGFRHSGDVGWSGVAYDVHLVGALFAVIYWRLGLRMSNFIPGKVSWRRNPFKRRPKLRVHPGPEAEMNLRELDEQADAILEKVNTHGLSSLSPNEQKILEAYSRRIQQKRR